MTALKSTDKTKRLFQKTKNPVLSIRLYSIIVYHTAVNVNKEYPPINVKYPLSQCFCKYRLLNADDIHLAIFAYIRFYIKTCVYYIENYSIVFPAPFHIHSAAGVFVMSLCVIER